MAVCLESIGFAKELYHRLHFPLASWHRPLGGYKVPHHPPYNIRLKQKDWCFNCLHYQLYHHGRWLGDALSIARSLNIPSVLAN